MRKIIIELNIPDDLLDPDETMDITANDIEVGNVTVADYIANQEHGITYRIQVFDSVKEG